MPARILVVDDLQPNIKLLQAKLTGEFYDVLTAEGGQEAIDLIENNPPDLILLDVMMPQMDGFEACRRIKANPKTASIPIVMVTALTEVEDRVQGLNAGADDFLTKPINDLALFARIRSLVRLKSMTDELRLRDETSASFGATEQLNPQLSNLSGAKVLLIDDDESQAQQVLKALKEKEVAVKCVTTPAEAVKEAEATDYDLIMVSTQLESDNGLHLCSHLRSLDHTRTTPLLILIEEDDNELLVKGLDMGINDYLIAPVDSNEVVARVSIQVRRKRFQDALKANQNKSLQMAITDGLTNVYNSSYFDIHVSTMLADALKYSKSLSLMIVDLDHFKDVNDNYGHQAGDAILKQVTKRISHCIRPTDLLARYGGEEFVILMPNTSLHHAAEVAERVRKVIEGRPFKIPVAPGSIACSISGGIAVSVAEDTPELLIERADKALYHVKNTGRNKIAAYCDTPPTR
jgi:two-component system cell cycle response regulator